MESSRPEAGVSFRREGLETAHRLRSLLRTTIPHCHGNPKAELGVESLSVDPKLTPTPKKAKIIILLVEIIEIKKSS